MPLSTLQQRGRDASVAISALNAGFTPSAARERLYRVLSTTSKGAFLVEGPSLVGKTWLLAELSGCLEKLDRRGVYLHRFACSPSHAGYEPVLDAIESLSKRENWSAKKKAIFFGIKYSGTAATVAGGLLRRLFPNAVPKEALDKIRTSLDTFSNRQPEKSATFEFPRSECSKICSLLNEVIKKAGRPLVILVDRLEELPTPGIKLLQMLVDIGTEKVLFVASVSSDSNAYSSRPDIRELVNSFKRMGGLVYSLSGYSVDELRSMRTLNGFPTSLESAQSAYEYSRSGIIGLVKDWLSSANESNNILRPAADQMVAHYSIQYGRLSEPAKNLVKCLGAVYPRGLSLAAAAVSLECKLGEVESKVQGVLGTFAALSNVDLVLSNVHVLHFIVKDVGGAFVQAAYTDLSLGIALNTVARLPEVAQGAQPTNLAAIPLSVHAMDVGTLLAEVRDDLLRGAHGAAMGRLQAWRAWAQRTTSPDEVTELLLFEADALGQMGAYSQAIERLEQVPAGSSKEVDVAVSIGEKYWRAGAQGVALRWFAGARQEARTTGRRDAWLKAATRTVAVKNEMREGLPSVRLAAKLAEFCDQDSTIPAREQCHVYRTVARTLALISSRRFEAEKYARVALEIAVNSTKSARDEGNARYALADVLRHRGSEVEAIVEYEVARAISERSGNHDLEIYALLGIAACAISQNNISRLADILRGLSNICSDRQLPERKIIALFTLARSRLAGEQVPFVDPAGSISGRPWTTNLLKVLSKPGMNTKAIQSATIVL